MLRLLTAGQLASRCVWCTSVLGFVACGGASPAEPATPSVAGRYALAITRCALAAEPSSIPMHFVCAASNRWTVTQVAQDVVGTTAGACPPFNWTGGFSARVGADGRMTIVSLAYRDSSSHSQIQTLAVTGTGAIDQTGMAGTLDGTYTAQATFGSAVGPIRPCTASGMSFRFSRQE